MVQTGGPVFSGRLRLPGEQGPPEVRTDSAGPQGPLLLPCTVVAFCVLPAASVRLSANGTVAKPGARDEASREALPARRARCGTGGTVHVWVHAYYLSVSHKVYHVACSV